MAGGLAICAIGVDAVRHVGQRREFLALAWIPLLLGAHQFIEALVWLWLQGHVPRGIGHVALWAYLLIAFVVLPVFVPLAGYRNVVIFGAVNLVAVIVIAWLTISGFASIWQARRPSPGHFLSARVAFTCPPAGG